MLPYPSSSEFPAALKARREFLGLSRSALARAANIHVVMPRRYEEPDCGEFARPRADSTWLALNKALGYEVPNEILAALTQDDPVNTADTCGGREPQNVIRGLTLAEAKAGLAATLGVSIECIEITIRG